MQIVVNKTSLVIAGSWNPAILNPSWIGKTVLNFEKDHEFEVLVEMGIAPLNFQKYTFFDISYTASPQYLIFYIDHLNAECVSKTIAAAKSILNVLSHTPVTGVGFNFEFLLNEQKDEFLNLFNQVDALNNVLNEMAVVSKLWGNTITADNELITVQCILEGAVGKITVNQHHALENATDAANYLQDGIFQASLKRVVAIASVLSADNLEE